MAGVVGSEHLQMVTKWLRDEATRPAVGRDAIKVDGHCLFLSDNESQVAQRQRQTSPEGSEIWLGNAKICPSAEEMCEVSILFYS